MTVQFVGKQPSELIGLKDEYRLTYNLSGSFFGFDDALNASGIESRLNNALPLIGLTVRSVPFATTGDSVVVVRVQPNDILVGSTVGRMADRADFSNFDFITLGVDNLTLGTNIDLAKVEYLGQIGQSGIPTGTTPIPSDAIAKQNADDANKEDTIWDRIEKVLKEVGIVAAIVGAVVIGLVVYSKER